MKMKYLLLAVLLAPAWAQPRVGLVEIYGERHVPAARIQQALGVRAGDTLTVARDVLEARLTRLDGIEQARVEAYCCDSGHTILYVGVRERNSRVEPFRPWPDGAEMAVPDEVAAAWREFSTAYTRAQARNDLNEDLSEGYSLMNDVNCSVAQQNFLTLAERYCDRLLEVLKNSDEAGQRAIAAYVLGYAPDQASVLDPLRAALSDPDAGVRANAARALRGLAAAGLGVEADALFDMLNSPELSDRLEAASTLLVRTARRDEDLLTRMRQRALPALLEAARWQHLDHARPAYLLAGRVAHIAGQELEAAWKAGQRNKMLVVIASSK